MPAYTKFEISTVITLVISIVTAAVFIGQLYGRLDSLEAQLASLNPTRIQEETENAVRRIHEESKGILERFATLPQQVGRIENRLKSLEQEPETIFGEWDEAAPVNQVRQVDSDGFLLAHSHGTGGARFYLMTGESESELIGRTRSNHFGGAVTPVKKDHYYRVRFDDDGRNDSPNNITAYWIPVRR